MKMVKNESNKTNFTKELLILVVYFVHFIIYLTGEHEKNYPVHFVIPEYTKMSYPHGYCAIF